MKKLLALLITTLLFTSCHISFNRSNDSKITDKTIAGAKYLFINSVDIRKTKVLFFSRFHIENTILFSSPEFEFETTIYKTDFEKKIGFSINRVFIIDSISFIVNENKDKVDLNYYLNLGDKTQKMTLELEKDMDRWHLN